MYAARYMIAALHMQHRNHILYLVEKFRTVILVGETGSGKTTQVRWRAWEADVYMCVCVDPLGADMVNP